MVPLQAPRRKVVLGLILATYACGRVLQVLFGPVPDTALVAVEVLSAMAFALADGVHRYGVRGISLFVIICLTVGNVVENIGVATGFPFGHYTFLAVMGPRFLAVPILLGFAYIGMAYVSWTLASLLVGPVSSRLRILTVPFVASLVMLAWDLAQDPVWSTMLRAWIWHDGGSWFGVPLSNYAGWFATIFSICLLFALYLYKQAAPPIQAANPSAVPAILFYALCAGGNILQLCVHRTAAEVPDGSGRLWRVQDILSASALVSVFVMGAFVAMAGIRLMESSSATD